METIYLSLGTQVVEGTFFMKSPVGRLFMRRCGYRESAFFSIRDSLSLTAPQMCSFIVHWYNKVKGVP